MNFRPLSFVRKSMNGSEPAFQVDNPLAGAPGFGTVRAMRRFLVVLFLTLTLCAASAAERIIDLSSQSEGRQPEGFLPVTGGAGKPGVWKIAADEVPSLLPAFTPNAKSSATQNVIAQSNTELESGRMPMLLIEEEEFADFTCKLRFKIVDGLLRQEAGMAFRFQDKDNYYVVRASPKDKKLRFSKIYNGQPVGAPIEVDAAVEKGKWHKLAVQCQGNAINVFLDDAQAIPTMNDNTFKMGAVGLWTLGDTVAYFTGINLDFKRRVLLAQKIVDDTLKKYGRLSGLQIYTLLPDKPGIHLVASSDKSEIGQLGGKTEESVIQNGSTAYGDLKRSGLVTVVVPLRDRNGDPVAAVRFKMKRVFGQSRRAAIARTTAMARHMNKRVLSVNDLVE